MSTNARQGWNAAQRASERPLHKRVEHKPVGDPRTNLLRGPWDAHCHGCGYYKCSCAPKPDPRIAELEKRAEDTRRFDAAIARALAKEVKPTPEQSRLARLQQAKAEREWRDNFQDVMLRNRAVLEAQAQLDVELEAITRELNRQVSLLAHTCPAHVERRIQEGIMPVVVSPALKASYCFVDDEAIYVSPMVYAKVKAEFAAKPESAREAADRMYREKVREARAGKDVTIEREYMGRWSDRPPPETPEQRAAFRAALADF